MDVLIDTSIWSVVFRRQNPDPGITNEVKKLIAQGRVKIIGPIRQELLSGIKHQNQYEILKSKLRAFPDEVIDTFHYEYAAELTNACLAHGIHPGSIDILICSVAKRNKLIIYSRDNDFLQYTKVIGLNLYKP